MKVYTSYANDTTKLNQITLYSLYGFLIIKACVFYDELTGQFERFNQNYGDAELNKEIAFYKGLFTNYDTKTLRNYISHNRKKVKNKITNQHEYEYITDDDLKNLKGMKSHPEYNSFSVGADLIVKSLRRLYPEAFEPHDIEIE